MSFLPRRAVRPRKISEFPKLRYNAGMEEPAKDQTPSSNRESMTQRIARLTGRGLRHDPPDEPVPADPAAPGGMSDETFLRRAREEEQSPDVAAGSLAALFAEGSPDDLLGCQCARFGYRPGTTRLSHHPRCPVRGQR